jgi:hypothetical protein
MLSKINSFLQGSAKVTSETAANYERSDSGDAIYMTKGRVTARSMSAKPIYIPVTSNTNIRVSNMHTIYKHIKNSLNSNSGSILQLTLVMHDKLMH